MSNHIPAYPRPDASSRNGLSTSTVPQSQLSGVVNMSSSPKWQREMERAQLTTWFFEPLKVGSVGVDSADGTNSARESFATKAEVRSDRPTVEGSATKSAGDKSKKLPRQRHPEKSAEHVPSGNKALNAHKSSQASAADQAPSRVLKTGTTVDASSDQLPTVVLSPSAQDASALIPSARGQQAYALNVPTSVITGVYGASATELEPALSASAMRARTDMLPRSAPLQSSSAPIPAEKMNVTEIVEEREPTPELESAATQVVARLLTSTGGGSVFNSEPQVGLYAEKLEGGVGVWLAIPASLENMRLHLPAMIAELQRIYASREHPLFKVICNGSIIWERKEKLGSNTLPAVNSSSVDVNSINTEMTQADVGVLDVSKFFL